MIMKLIATAVLALGLLSGAAQAASYYDGYPDWAQSALEPKN
jgi:hypothetical protein